MKLAVIGASGLVGAELVRQARARSIPAVGAARNVQGEATQSVDLADPKSIARFLAEHSPTHVVVGSAWPYVDGCEQDPARSHRANVETVANLIAEAPKETVVVFFSTDHVFDGEKKSAYVESDATHPLSVYARHKLETENLLLERGNALVVRTAWAFGEELGKKNFVYRVKTVAERGETLEVPVDQSGCPTWTGWLTRTTLSLLETKMTGVLHATGREAFTKAEWARAIAEALGLQLRVQEVSWEKSGQIAPRPVRVALTSERHSLVQPPVRELLAALSL
ncbi:MAG: SDR family oxidoreductase [Polyangiaceae bacterium]